MSQRLRQFDPLGTALLIPGLIMLLLALQWGGNDYSWKSTRVIVLLVLGLALLVAFGVSQYWIGNNGTVPPRLLRQRTIAAATAISIGSGAALLISAFYLPIWFQAIKGQTAVGAGERLLPYFLGTVIFVIGGGIATSKIGYYTPFVMAGAAITIVGYGLLTTFNVDTSTGKWVGYQASFYQVSDR